MRRFQTTMLAATLALLAAGCSGPPAVAQITPTIGVTPSPALTPYHSATPRPARVFTPAGSPTPLPTLTPTPLSYKVVKGDDMFGIALRHGISLPVLLTANPTVNPSFLSVGTILQIPQGQATPLPGESTPVPEAVDLAAPHCYPTDEGGLWCLAAAHNPADRSLENLSIAVLVSGEGGSGLVQQEAYALVNLLPAGESLVLGAYFPPPALRPGSASASVQTAFFQPEDDVRYTGLVIMKQPVEILPGGAAARVRGSLSLEAGSPADEIWVAASAYDATGSPVGLRRWEAPGEFSPGETVEFDFMIYSLGPAIARVELLAEAHTALSGPTGTPTLTPAN